jgi:phenylalanyl-tRNA synthetase beta chain
VSRALTAAGLAECITYAFVDPDRLRAMGWDDASRLVSLQNPLSRERSVLRPAILPGLLEVLALNANRGTPDVKVFELGHTFAPRREDDVDRPLHEELWLAVALTGLRERRGWSASKERVDVFDAKGMAELALGAAGAASWETVPWPPGEGPAYLEAGRAAALRVGGGPAGWFGELSLAVREAFDLATPVFVAELSLTAAGAVPEPTPRYRALPRFPAVQRDLALVVPAAVTAGEVEAHLEGMRIPLLARIRLFDVYEGGQVGEGRRSLAFNLTYQAPDRTLTDREVNDLHAGIVAGVRERFAAEIRGA